MASSLQEGGNWTPKSSPGTAKAKKAPPPIPNDRGVLRHEPLPGLGSDGWSSQCCLQSGFITLITNFPSPGKPYEQVSHRSAAPSFQNAWSENEHNAFLVQVTELNWNTVSMLYLRANAADWNSKIWAMFPRGHTTVSVSNMIIFEDDNIYCTFLGRIVNHIHTYTHVQVMRSPKGELTKGSNARRWVGASGEGDRLKEEMIWSL